MHHIFFPPRLDAAFVERMPERHSARRRFFVFQHALAQEVKRPMLGPFRRIGADDCNEVRLGLVVERGRPSGARSVEESAIQTLRETVADADNRTLADFLGAGDARGRFASVEAQQDARAVDHPCKMLSFSDSGAEALTVVRAEADGWCSVHIPQVYRRTRRQDFMNGVLA